MKPLCESSLIPPSNFFSPSPRELSKQLLSGDLRKRKQNAERMPYASLYAHSPSVPGVLARATLSVSYQSVFSWIFCLFFFFFFPKQSGAYFILVSELNLFLFIVVSDVFYLNLTIFFFAYSFSYCLN